jgi:hypothetical protein
MFAYDVTEFDTAETLAESARLYALANQLETQRLRLAVHYADLSPSPAILPDQPLPGGERTVFHGGPGCPGLAEFAPAAYGTTIGISKAAAAKYLGQGLALRHRLPLTWAQVVNGHATEWKARQIATACAKLSVQAAAIVDRRVAHLVDSVTPYRLSNIVRAAKWTADPDAAHAEAYEQATQRGVWPGRSDDHGTTTLYLKAASGDVIRFDATIAQIADALAAIDEPGTLDQRRAKAIGIIADPILAHQLLDVARHLASTAPTSTQGPTHQDPTGDRAGSSTPTTGETRADDTAHHDTAHADEPTATPASAQPATPSNTAPAHAAPPAEATATTSCATRTDEASVGVAPTAGGSGGAVHGNDSQADQVAAAEVTAADVTWDGQPASELFLADEPDDNTEADRDAPHPSHPDHPLDPPAPRRPRTRNDSSAAPSSATAERALAAMDAAARSELAGKLTAIRQAANTNSSNTNNSSGGGGGGSGGRRPARTKLYLHITDETLLAGGGVARVEQYGPVFAAKLAELLGHDQITVQPVIDLNQHVSVDAYEIPDRIRERVKLTYPVEQFPYGTAETTNSTDLDHVVPYDPTGPPGQTSSRNLRPQGRLSHRIKTYGGWKVRTLDNHALEWTTKHGLKFRVDQTGTHPITDDPT